jgi:hypothetical protein
MSVSRRVVAGLGALAALVLGAAGCGGEDDFENEARAASPIELTVAIKDRELTVSPDELGAGAVIFTISNQSPDPATLTLSGPTDYASGEILPGGVANLKSALEEGTYEVSAGEESDARPDRLEVGPPRETSQNDLLLP